MGGREGAEMQEEVNQKVFLRPLLVFFVNTVYNLIFDDNSI